jgi:hypothetical protein
MAEVVRRRSCRDHTSVCVFDFGQTTKATATAMPAPHTPQTTLTKKMIAVAMHALPGSPGLPSVSAKKDAPLEDLLHEWTPVWWPKLYCSLDINQRSRVIRKVRRIKHLDPSIVLAVERRHGICATRLCGVVGTIEPQSKMIHLDWPCHRIWTYAWEWLIIKSKRCRSGARRDDKGLDTETADKSGVSIAV